MKRFICASAVVIALVWNVVVAQETQDKPQTSPNSSNPSEQKASIVPSEGQTTAPHALYAPNPDYTARARKAGMEGTVGLQMTVTPQGTVDDVKVVKKLDPELDQQALVTVRTWKFRPATKNGQPVPVKISVSVTFSLYRHH